MWVILLFFMGTNTTNLTTMHIPNFTTKANCESAGNKLQQNSALLVSYYCMQVK